MALGSVCLGTRAELERVIKQARERLSEESKAAKKSSSAPKFGGGAGAGVWNGSKFEDQVVNRGRDGGEISGNGCRSSLQTNPFRNNYHNNKVTYSSKLQQQKPTKDGPSTSASASKRITPTPASVARTQSSLFASGSSLPDSQNLQNNDLKTKSRNFRSEMLSDLFAIKPRQQHQAQAQRQASQGKQDAADSIKRDDHRGDLKNPRDDQQQHHSSSSSSSSGSSESKNGLAALSFTLSPAASAIARAHAESLKAGLVPNTHQEMRTLFEAVGLHALVQNSAPGLVRSLFIELQSKKGMEDTNEKGAVCSYAPAYSCAVLAEASELVLQMGERVLEAMSESSALKAFAPRLIGKVIDRLESIRSSRLRYKNFYDELPQGSVAPAYLRRPMVLPGGESRPLNMLPNEAKRLKNREEARDSFVNLLGHLQDFLNKHELLNSKIDRAFALTKVHSANAHKRTGHDDYESLHSRIRLFTSTLHIDNIQWFSQLFMERILQTASMGEMDEEVVVLANADPSKMRRLHQRMTISNNARGKSQQGSFGMTDYRNASKTNDSHIGGGGGGGSTSSKKYQRVVTQLNGPSGMELIQSILINFPINLRIYTLFLLIADSQRLNEQLESKMLKRIFDLATWLSSSMPPSDISERVLSCKALALFLGYFAFCCNKDKACVLANDMLQQIGKKEEDRKFLQYRSLLDASRLIKCSLSIGTLPFTLPWISDYLQLAKYSERNYNEELRNVLSQLWSLRSSLSVETHAESFGTAALCMRICIDNLFQEWGLDVQSENVHKFFQDLGQPSLVAERLKMNVANNMLDQKCIQACCPELDELAALIDEISLNTMNTKPSLRKITPVTPAKNEARKVVPNDFNIDSNKTLRAALLCREDSQESRDKALTLQRAMLDRYPELKNVIDFVVDAVARNAVDDTIGSTIREECMKALAVNDKERGQLSTEDWNMNETYKSIAISSFQQIRLYVKEKVPMALQVLSPPNLDSRVASCAVEIGVEASLITAAKRLLDRIPLEFQKCSREKVRAAMDNRKKRMSMPTLPGINSISSNLECSVELAAKVTKSCMLNKASDSQEEAICKIRSIAFQLNASLNIFKKSKYPSLPLVDEYHALWRDGSPMPDCLELLGYVWSDLLFVLIKKELDLEESSGKSLVELSGELYGYMVESVFDQLDLSSMQPPVYFGLGIVSKFIDSCSFHLVGLLELVDLALVESCSIEILSSLLHSGILHPRNVQEILIRLLDEPGSLGQYTKERDERDTALYEKFVSKYLQREANLSASTVSLYFAQILPKLSDVQH